MLGYEVLGAVTGGPTWVMWDQVMQARYPFVGVTGNMEGIGTCNLTLCYKRSWTRVLPGQTLSLIRPHG